MTRVERMRRVVLAGLTAAACGDASGSTPTSGTTESATDATTPNDLASGSSTEASTSSGPGSETSTSGSATTSSSGDDEDNTQEGSADESSDTTADETDEVTGQDDGDDDTPTCDTVPPLVVPFPTDLEQRSEWAHPDEYASYTQGIWSLWWHPNFDHAADARWLANELEDIRCRSLSELGMRDPPNPAAGVRYNVYIHHGPDDPFPEGWANGQGTNADGLPFLTLPDGAHLDPGNVAHEGFHVFQYSADSPGFEYRGDSQWYIEASAQWYAAYRRPRAEGTFIEAGSIDANPHLALWHSFDNQAAGDPTDWLFQVRQYGMHTWLYYLSEVAGIDRDIITAGFYGGVTESPQAYIYRRAGPERLVSIFADWAAHTTADFDYLTRDQVRRARDEVQNVADLDNLHPYVAEYHDAGTDGLEVAPPPELAPRGWSYNVIKVTNSMPSGFRFELAGKPSGSEGAASRFEGRLVVIGSSGTRFIEVDMDDATTGRATVELTDAEAELFVVIVAVPEHFTGNQRYEYTYRLTREQLRAHARDIRARIHGSASGRAAMLDRDRAGAAHGR